MKVLPFDYASAALNPGWRRELSWVLLPDALRDVGYVLAKRVADFAFQEVQNEDSRALLLAAPGMINQVLISLEAAWSISLAQQIDVRLVAQADEFRWLLGETTELPRPGFRRAPVARSAHKVLLRSVARTATWTSPLRLPAVLGWPHAFAVNHNALLRQEARQSGKRIVSANGDHLLLSARAAYDQAPQPDPARVAALVEMMVGLIPVDGALAARLRALLTEKVRFHLQAAKVDLAALQDIRLPAEDMWAGTGGNRIARALAMEVIRRGGRVSGFDHGGSTGMLGSGVPLAMSEGGVASEFVSMSPRLAEMCRTGPLGQEIRQLRDMPIKAGHGDPHIRSVRFPQPLRGTRRPRVMLMTGALLGYRQINPTLPRDPVYLDWHMRLVESLQTLPYDLVLKPHPEGIFRGLRHPLEDMGPTIQKPFEESLAEADILVFDFPLSTTFWTAMCSDHPIVFAELGIAPLNPQIMTMIGRRCQHVTAAWGDDGLPRLDRNLLAEALRSALVTPVDATEFRSLFLDAA